MSKKTIFLIVGLTVSVLFFVVEQPVLANSIEVIYPNGGETLVIGQQYTISWNQSSSDVIDIYIKNYTDPIYIDDPTSPYLQYIGGYSYAAGTNSIDWTVPSTAVPDTDYRLMILNEAETASDMSDGFFSVFTAAAAAPATLPAPTLISPENNENLVSYPTFQWYSVTNAKAYQYKVYDSTGNTELESWQKNYEFGSTQIGGTSLVNGIYKWRVRACADLLGVAVPSDSTCGPWSDMWSFTVGRNGTFSFSQHSFYYAYRQGGAIPASQSLTFANTSDVVVNYTISMPNKPSWFNTGYNTEQLTSDPGSSAGLSASVDPTALVPGTYVTNVVLTGNFVGSPKTIPIVLEISAPSSSTLFSYPDGTVVKTPTSDKIYLIENSQKRWIVGPEAFIAYGLVPNTQLIISHIDLGNYPSGSDITVSSVNTNNIPEGGLIRAIGTDDVYIVKYIGLKRFKRLILSPEVFNSYGHLEWSDVKDVDASVLDSFTTSNLVCASGDTAVYQLYPSGDTGLKRWVKSMYAFSRLGFDWDSVYRINELDRDTYTTGAGIE